MNSGRLEETSIVLNKSEKVSKLFNSALNSFLDGSCFLSCGHHLDSRYTPPKGKSFVVIVCITKQAVHECMDFVPKCKLWNYISALKLLTHGET